MREKLETLSLAKLKEFAKEQEIKGYGSMRKAELIDILCEKAGEKEGKSAPADVSTGNEVSVSDAGSGNRLLHHLLLCTNVWGDYRI